MLGSEVTIIEAMDSVLPIFDKELRRQLEIAIKKQKIKVHTKVFAKGIDAKDDGSVDLLYTPKDAEEGTEFEKLNVDKVLVTVGRRPMSAALSPTGVALDER